MNQHITVKEAAAKLSCCEETIRRLVSKGKLPALKLSHELRIDEKHILERLKVKPK